MQDRYTGDVGDFGKYGLLKTLCGDDLSLDVIWYLFPDERGSGDGSHVRYLEPTPDNLRRFRDCDPDLYHTLRGMVRDGARSVRSVRERLVLPPGSVFYEEILSFGGMAGIGARRVNSALSTGMRGCRVPWARSGVATSCSRTPTTAWSPRRCSATTGEDPSTPT